MMVVLLYCYGMHHVLDHRACSCESDRHREHRWCPLGSVNMSNSKFCGPEVVLRSTLHSNHHSLREKLRKRVENTR